MNDSIITVLRKLADIITAPAFNKGDKPSAYHDIPTGLRFDADTGLVSANAVNAPRLLGDTETASRRTVAAIATVEGMGDTLEALQATHLTSYRMDFYRQEDVCEALLAYTAPTPTVSLCLFGAVEYAVSQVMAALKECAEEEGVFIDFINTTQPSPFLNLPGQLSRTSYMAGMQPPIGFIQPSLPPFNGAGFGNNPGLYSGGIPQPFNHFGQGVQQYPTLGDGGMDYRQELTAQPQPTSLFDVFRRIFNNHVQDEELDIATGYNAEGQFGIAAAVKSN